MDIIKKIKKAKIIFLILPELSIDDLEQAILVSSKSYHNTGISLISDSDYDALVDRLKQLDPDSSVLHRTGAAVAGSKVELPYWMGSMDKVKSDDKLIKKWLKKFGGPFVISDKLDGISCLLQMLDGEIRLYTRGDGTYGRDVTHLLDYINMSIDKLEKMDVEEITIRGELIMSKENFEKYESEMSNARNMVAGIVNSKKKSLNTTYAADVDFVAYELIEPRKKPSEQMTALKKYGLNVVYYDIYNYISLEILDAIYQKRKKKSPYEVDGIIVTDDRKYSRNVSGNPEYSFAYKGMTPTADVKVIEVLWRPSKDGILVPRIHFEKVRLSQADLEYTTGFNAKFIVDNDIGPGAIITIIRSGEVIPYVMGIVKPAKRPSLPDVDYEWDKNHVNIILIDAHDNKDVIISRLTKFMRDIGVDNLSEGIVARLFDHGYNNIIKMISITVDDFLEIEGFKHRLATKLYNNLQSALDRLDILTLMKASNLFGRGYGERKIKKILDVYPNIVDQFSNKNYDVWYDQLMDIEGFDTISVESFLSSLPDFQKFYRKILKIVDVKPYVNVSNNSGIFKNQTIVFTGFRNAAWQKFIEEEGGKVSSSVSRNTTLLVYNDGEESSAKFQKAKQLGIETVPKSDFARVYNL